MLRVGATRIGGSPLDGFVVMTSPIGTELSICRTCFWRYTPGMRLPVRYHVGGVICLALTLFASMQITESFSGAVFLWLVWWIPVGFLLWRLASRSYNSH